LGANVVSADRLILVGWVGVAAEEFFGVVGVVDFGLLCPFGPGQAAGVGVDGAAGGLVRAVVDLRVVARLTAIRTGAAAVAGKTVLVVIGSA
jgi:hypothetical protein